MRIKPNRIRFSRIPHEDQLQIHLEFPDHAKRRPIVFDISFDDAMRLMFALRALQVKYKIPIPPTYRPSGKPKLWVVDDDS